MSVLRWLSWRTANAVGAGASAVLWAAAGVLGWVDSVTFVSHVSMLTMVSTFVAAWRADVPNRRRG